MKKLICGLDGDNITLLSVSDTWVIEYLGRPQINFEKEVEKVSKYYKFKEPKFSAKENNSKEYTDSIKIMENILGYGIQ